MMEMREKYEVEVRNQTDARCFVLVRPNRTNATDREGKPLPGSSGSTSTPEAFTPNLRRSDQGQTCFVIYVLS
jgi:hypothetical protein